MSVARPTRQKLSILALSLSLAMGLAMSPAALAQSQEQKQALAPPANATEASLRELYNTEWDWRQKEFAREKIDGRWYISHTEYYRLYEAITPMASSGMQLIANRWSSSPPST